MMLIDHYDFNPFSLPRVLLNANADVQIRCKDGSTPVHIAAKFGALDCLKVFAEHSVDLRVSDNSGLC